MNGRAVAGEGWDRVGSRPDRRGGPLMRWLAPGLVLALVAVAGTVGVAAAQVGKPAPAVEPRFDLDAPGRAPFPSDRLTVPDPTQRTGLRVALPLPSCAAARSDCDDLRLLNELDGFDLSPRLALPFSGAIDLATVTPRSVFLVRLAAGPPEVMAIDRLVYDPDAHTLYARPEALLEAETRYGLVVTRGVREASGRPIRPSGLFHRFLRAAGGPPAVRGYREGLRRLMSALSRRGLQRGDVAVATVFTTGSVTTFLEQAREALDRRSPRPALMAVPDEGGRAYYPRGSVAGLVLQRQVAATTDAVPADGAFREVSLPLGALPRDAVGGLGVGWYWSPWYLTAERRILETPTARPQAPAPSDAPVPFVIVLPAGKPPVGGWPLAIFGHGYGREMFEGALLIAGTLARLGIATAAITVVGHGGGPESRLLVRYTDGRVTAVRVPGRGIDLDGDGRIEATEGLATPSRGPLASLALRDGLRQQVIDLMAFVRALRGGLDVDGDGVPDTSADRVFYAGQSLGGIYGTLFLAVEPRVAAGVLNVVGGPIAEIARLSPVFRSFVRDALARRTPPLLNRERGFREDLPLRGDPPVTAPVPGALAIQEYLARVEWLGRRGDPVAYARHLRLAPLPGREPARVLIQFARGDRVVPNPTTSGLVRAGALDDLATQLRYDRVVSGVPKEWAEAHGFLLRVGAPGVVGALARAAQEQVARFFLADDATVWNPDHATPPPYREPVFEIPAISLPDALDYEPGDEAEEARP